ncbi:hypothetical protein KY285_020179 [Solanum tuberosum]|nr:hypothetical protein KY289_020425 [Solanum tuberosum]KAH0693082.1 hypothetical protein KY285_020179 [Solanum tuberosum]
MRLIIHLAAVVRMACPRQSSPLLVALAKLLVTWDFAGGCLCRSLVAATFMLLLSSKERREEKRGIAEGEEDDQRSLSPTTCGSRLLAVKRRNERRRGKGIEGSGEMGGGTRVSWRRAAAQGDALLNQAATSSVALAGEDGRRVCPIKATNGWDLIKIGQNLVSTFPNVHLPPGFKTPKFDKYDGHGDPIAHIKIYCNQLRGAGGKEELLMDDMAQDFVRQFQYNVDIMPDHNTLSNMRKKANKSFREYVIKWREQAAQVKPPLDEKELVDIFIEAQDPNYFYHLTATIGRTFHTLIKIGEMVESGLKTGRIVSQASIKATTQVIQGGPSGFGNCKRKDISISIRGLQCLVIFSSSQSPLFSGPNSRKPSPTTTTLSGPIQLSSYAKLCSRAGTKNEIHSIGRVISSLFQKLKKIGVIKSIPPHYLNLNAPGFQANDILFVVTDDQNTPNVTNSPLPAQNNLVGMICDDQEYKLLSKMVKLFSKIGEEDKSIKSLEPVTSLSVEGVNLDTKVLCVLGVSKRLEVRSSMPILYVSKGFSLTQQDQSCVAKLKEPILVKPVQQLPVTNPKVVPWNYNKIVVFYRGKEIVEEVYEARGLTRSGRCYSPKELRKGKMAQDIQVPLKKILNEAHVSKETTVNQLEKMANRIFESNTITFTDDELPTEGAGHNRALHLIVKCEGNYVNRVIIDGGSGHDTIGEIKLNMTIGPVDFMIVFQVMDMDTSYNFLLGRPWIQMAQAVPSTLHQVVNFEYDHQEIIVHGKMIYLFIEIHPFHTWRQMRHVLSLFTSLLRSYQSIDSKKETPSSNHVSLFPLQWKQGTFGLGYKQSKRNEDKAKNHKMTDWVLP